MALRPYKVITQDFQGFVGNIGIKKDTYIDENNPTTNYGTVTTILEVGEVAGKSVTGG
jgi:hypothetical protein